MLALLFMKYFIYICFFLSFTVPQRGYPWGAFYMEFFAIVAAIFICINSKKNNIKINFLQICIIALIVTSFVSVIFVNDYSGIQLIVLLFLYLGLFLLVANAFSQEENDVFFEGVLVVIVLAALVNVMIQFLQFFEVENIYSFSLPLVGNRPFGNMGQSNHLGTLLVIALFAGFYFLIKNYIGNIVAIFLGIFLLFGIALTDSRTALLSLVCGVAYLLITKENRKKAAIFLVPAIPLIFLIKIFLSQFIPQRLDAGENFSSRRWEMWQLFADAIMRKPWLGYGFNNTIGAHFEVVDDHPIWWHENIQQAHNIFIDFLVWFGVPVGLLFSLAFSYFFIKKFLKSLREVRIQIPLLLCIPLLVHSLLEYPLHYFYFLLIFAVFVGRLMILDGKHCTEIKNGKNYLLLVIVPIAMIIGIEYIKTQEVIKLQRRAMLSDGFIPDEARIKNIVLDELSDHVYLLKRVSSYQEEDYQLLEKLVKIYPIKISFDKLIEKSKTESERDFWENKKYQLTPKEEAD